MTMVWGLYMPSWGGAAENLAGGVVLLACLASALYAYAVATRPVRATLQSLLVGLMAGLLADAAWLAWAVSNSTTIDQRDAAIFDLAPWELHVVPFLELGLWLPAACIGTILGWLTYMAASVRPPRPAVGVQASSALAALVGIGFLTGCGAARLPEVPDVEGASLAVAESKLGDELSIEQLEKTREALRPLHVRLGPPKPGEWLEKHPETGQTFDEYVASKPVTPQGVRKTIYVQPIGEYTATERKIVNLTAEFLSLYFNCPVKVKQDLPLDLIPAKARREGQLLTGYILSDILAPRLPDDAAAYLALTSNDLWPGEGWNYVFGQASLNQRVGVWSLHRYGDPDASEAAYQLCLLRTLKVAAHETGHMFSILHCTAYECCMCGANHLRESDSKPLALCPECVVKVCWAGKADPVERYQKLAEFCRKHGLTDEARFYEKSIEVLKK